MNLKYMCIYIHVYLCVYGEIQGCIGFEVNVPKEVWNAF